MLYFCSDFIGLPELVHMLVSLALGVLLFSKDFQDTDAEVDRHNCGSSHTPSVDEQFDVLR